MIPTLRAAPNYLKFGLMFFALLMVGGTAWYRYQHADFSRPLAVDEVGTLRQYTWLAFDDEMQQRRLLRQEDLEQLGRPNFRSLLTGVYCSLGRWTEPKNHIANSLLINFSFPLLKNKEAAIRLPALLGAVMSVVAMMWLCSRDLCWFAISPILALG